MTSKPRLLWKVFIPFKGSLHGGRALGLVHFWSGLGSFRSKTDLHRIRPHPNRSWPLGRNPAWILVFRLGQDGHWYDNFRCLPRVLRLGHGDGGAQVSSHRRNSLSILLHVRILHDVSRRVLTQRQLASLAGLHNTSAGLLR